jgi:hypothetical protein
MTSESTYELQKIDSNCNNCGFLRRDQNKYKVWDRFHYDLQLEEYQRDRNKALFLAYVLRDKTNLAKLFKQKLHFRRTSAAINYGFCQKFDFKEVSFIPGTFQIETQKCFIHRKDYVD